MTTLSMRFRQIGTSGLLDSKQDTDMSDFAVCKSRNEVMLKVLRGCRFGIAAEMADAPTALTCRLWRSIAEFSTQICTLHDSHSRENSLYLDLCRFGIQQMSFSTRDVGHRIQLPVHCLRHLSTPAWHTLSTIHRLYSSIQPDECSQIVLLI
jgi:hypothetical protein